MSVSSPPRTTDVAPRPEATEPQQVERESEPRPPTVRSAPAGRARALIEEAWRRTGRRRILIAAVWTAAAAGAIALALGLLRPTEPSGGSESSVGLSGQPAAAVPVGRNGTLAMVGTSAAGTRTDIYVLATGDTVPRQLTSTPALDEYAPSWSPDGSRLAYIRSDPPDRELSEKLVRTHGVGYAASCATVCEVVVADGRSGTTMFSLDIGHTFPGPEPGFDGSMVPDAIAWAPSGTALIVDRSSCGIGGCGGHGPVGSVLVDVANGRTVEVAPEVSVLGWSPDGRWLALAEERPGSRRSVVVVPGESLDETSLTAPLDRDGWIVLSEAPSWPLSVGWTSDSSAILVNEGMIFGAGPGERWEPATIDLITVPDGRRRTVIADGAHPMPSSDGRHLAYHTGYELDGDDGIPTDIWVADVDGTGALRVAGAASADSWSPDGRILAAHDDRSWFTIAADGTGRRDLAVRAVGDGVPWGPTASWQRAPAAE